MVERQSQHFASTAQQDLISGVLSTPFNAKHSTVGAAVGKMNSISARPNSITLVHPGKKMFLRLKVGNASYSKERKYLAMM